MRNALHPRWFAFSLLVACASRAGYVEPGPLSANANPPPAAGVAASPGLQPSRTYGSSSEGPPRLNFAGGEVREEHPSRRESPLPTECTADADCAPTACCHPTSCAPAARAPSCAATTCTTDCVAGTLDCGQARCACVVGRCGVMRAHGA